MRVCMYDIRDIDQAQQTDLNKLVRYLVCCHVPR